MKEKNIFSYLKIDKTTYLVDCDCNLYKINIPNLKTKKDIKKVIKENLIKNKKENICLINILKNGNNFNKYSL